MEENGLNSLRANERHSEGHSPATYSPSGSTQFSPGTQGHTEAESAVSPCAESSEERTRTLDDRHVCNGIQDRATHPVISHDSMRAERPHSHCAAENVDNISEPSPVRSNSWRSFLLYFPREWQFQSLFESLTKTWIGNLITLISLAVGLVPLCFGLHLQLKSWKLQTWTARKDAKESCMNDKVCIPLSIFMSLLIRTHSKSLGMPLSQFCHAILHQQTYAPPFLRRRTSNPFIRNKEIPRSMLLESDLLDKSSYKHVGDVRNLTAIIVISVAVGILTVVYFWSRREPHRPVVSMVRNEGNDTTRFTRISWISFAKMKTRQILGTPLVDGANQEDQMLLGAPDEDLVDSDSDTWTIPEDEKRVQFLFDQMEQDEFKDNTSKEDREELARILDLKDALKLSGRLQCVVMFRYMTFQQFEKRFRCHLNRAQNRPHPFPSYGLYDFTPLSWRGVKDFYKHRKQGQFPKLEVQLLDLKAQFPLPKEYENTLIFEERSPNVSHSNSSDKCSEFLNRRPDTLEKVAQYGEIVRHFSQTFESAEDPIYLFQFDLGMFALLKPTLKDALDINGDASSQPSAGEAHSLWHTVTLGVQADIVQYESAIEFMNYHLTKPDASPMATPSSESETHSWQEDFADTNELQEIDEQTDQAVLKSIHKDSSPSQRETLRRRLKGLKHASLRKLRP